MIHAALALIGAALLWLTAFIVKSVVGHLVSAFTLRFLLKKKKEPHKNVDKKEGTE